MQRNRVEGVAEIREVYERLRGSVGPEDVKELAPDSLPHRLSVRGGTSGVTAEAVIREVLESVPVPA